MCRLNPFYLKKDLSHMTPEGILTFSVRIEKLSERKHQKTKSYDKINFTIRIKRSRYRRYITLS